MKKWVIAVSAVAVLVGASALFLKNANLEVCATASGERPVFVPTITASPAEGEKVNLLSGKVYDVATNYEMCMTEAYFPSGDAYAPDDVKMSWKSEEGASYYTVRIGTDKKLSKAQEYVTMEQNLSISDLHGGTHYYYQVVATFEEKTVKSRIFDFETAALPRTIYIEGVSNTRDMGGYLTADGKHRIRQGMVYRGGTMDEITEEGRQKALGTYGIKTDLDLRNSNEGLSTSPLGAEVNYIKVGGPYYTGDNGIENSKYREALLTEIKTFANKDNYPIYVHCSLGKDRTGTICFLINALCGVEKEDLYLDYELSYLSTRGCMDKNSPPSFAVGQIFTSLYNMIDHYRIEGTLAEKTEAFLLDMGVTKNEIASIRSIMLEEVK